MVETMVLSSFAFGLGIGFVAFGCVLVAAVPLTLLRKLLTAAGWDTRA